MLYEKPNFKGDKIALDEGDIELTYPFNPPEEQQQQNGQKEGEEQKGETSGVQTESKPARKFIIGSIRRAVRVSRVQLALLLAKIVNTHPPLKSDMIQILSVVIKYVEIHFIIGLSIISIRLLSDTKRLNSSHRFLALERFSDCMLFNSIAPSSGKSRSRQRKL